MKSMSQKPSAFELERKNIFTDKIPGKTLKVYETRIFL